ncbi:hypothetical protein ACLOJK_040384, partial [Asimina triloba]
MNVHQIAIPCWSTIQRYSIFPSNCPPSSAAANGQAARRRRAVWTAARDGWTLEVDRADGRHATAGRDGVRLLGVSPSTDCRGGVIAVLLRGVDGQTDLLSGGARLGGRDEMGFGGGRGWILDGADGHGACERMELLDSSAGFWMEQMGMARVSGWSCWTRRLGGELLVVADDQIWLEGVERADAAGLASVGEDGDRVEHVILVILGGLVVRLLPSTLLAVDELPGRWQLLKMGDSCWGRWSTVVWYSGR